MFIILNSTGHETNVTFSTITGFSGIPYPYPSSGVNLTTFEDQRVGYLYIKYFVPAIIEPYSDKILNFYNQIEDYSHLIIDIRGNTGGFYSEWIENIVRPLIKEDILHEQYFAYRIGRYVNYLHQEWVTKLDQVSKDQFDYLPPEVLTDEFKIYRNYMTYNPTFDVEFNGNIILLTDNIVYSAAEGFANFCKEKGFAKIYGTTSGGDGIMLWPQYFVLPNSKLVIELASAMGLDNTGHANEEVRTQPDVYYESAFGDFNELINYVLEEIS